jgi:hypothetical protein
MALTRMTKRDSWKEGYEYTETIADGATGDDIRIFPLGLDGPRVTCRIIAGANTGKFQFTTSPDANVIAGTATWSDWPRGVVTGTVWDALTSQVTGLRGVSVSGEIKIEVVI